MERATVLRIERSSIHDGEGLRTVIFLKGCPLRCAWCSTPESQQAEIEMIDQKTYGELMSVDQLMEEISKDEIFFFHSNGGITFSGGEPLMYADFVASTMKRCRKLGISTAVETSMICPYSELEKILPYLNILYADLKHLDPLAHQEFTGADNTLILANIERAARSKLPFRLIIRIPVIPGLNDSDDLFEKTGKYLQGLEKLEAVELLPYHRLGLSTYEKMGIAYSLPEVKVPSKSYLEKKKKILRAYVDKVI